MPCQLSSSKLNAPDQANTRPQQSPRATWLLMGARPQAAPRWLHVWAAASGCGAQTSVGCFARAHTKHEVLQLQSAAICAGRAGGAGHSPNRQAVGLQPGPSQCMASALCPLARCAPRGLGRERLTLAEPLSAHRRQPRAWRAAAAGVRLGWPGRRPQRWCAASQKISIAHTVTYRRSRARGGAAADGRWRGAQACQATRPRRRRVCALRCSVTAATGCQRFSPQPAQARQSPGLPAEPLLACRRPGLSRRRASLCAAATQPHSSSPTRTWAAPCGRVGAARTRIRKSTIRLSSAGCLASTAAPAHTGLGCTPLQAWRVPARIHLSGLAASFQKGSGALCSLYRLCVRRVIWRGDNHARPEWRSSLYLAPLINPAPGVLSGEPHFKGGPVGRVGVAPLAANLTRGAGTCLPTRHRSAASKLPRPCHGAARCSDYSLAVIQQVAQVGFLRRLDLVSPEHAI